ncbi:MAG: MFS transporter [Limisphaerales bacterium]
MNAAPIHPVPTRRAYLWLTTLVVGYIGIYLCRKNFSVAIPLIQQEWGVSKEEIGRIASYSTFAYMIGKFLFGPIIDRYGGRAGFLFALAAVALFGGAGAMGSSIGSLMIFYSLNRFAGSAGWGGMVKLVPDWFPAHRLPLAFAVLSLSFVFGGVCATLLAGEIASWSGNNWRWVMGGPSIVLAVILVGCWAILPRDSHPVAEPVPADSRDRAGFDLSRFKELAGIRQFWIVCALSFTLTLLRETFNTWAVDFFKTTGGAELSTRIAAFLSTPFDALGAVGILLLGWVFGRLEPRTRSYLLMTILSALALLVFLLPGLTRWSLAAGTVTLGFIGFLAYGPYSLLAGILAMEIRGKGYVATVAGMVDGVGYLASILAGQLFGRILDAGGYSLGFSCLSGLAVTAAVLCLFLYPKSANAAATEAAPPNPTPSP